MTCQVSRTDMRGKQAYRAFVMTGEAFVRGVMERLGVATAAALADAMGWPRGKERTVSRWLSGETNPSYANVMQMVERAGLLNNDGAAPAAPVAPADPLAQLAANDETLLENQDAAMGLLTEIRDAVLRAPAGQRSAPKRRGR